MADEVTPLFPGAEQLPENTLAIDKENPSVPYYCGHESIRIDNHQRRVYCAKCKANLDPFEFLRDNARHLQQAWDSYRQVHIKVREVLHRLDDLKKEEKRLKARVKSLQEKTGELITIRGKSLL